MPDIVTFLTFAHQAEEAANWYVSLFPNSRIVEVQRWGEGGQAPAGSVLTVRIELDGMPFVCLNAGQPFPFGEGVSFAIMCRSQDEVDHYYDTFADGGREFACGWVQDRYGVVWQVTPTILPELLASPDKQVAQRTMACMMTMKKLDVAALRAAAAGDAAPAARTSS